MPRLSTNATTALVVDAAAYSFLLLFSSQCLHAQNASFDSKFSSANPCLYIQERRGRFLDIYSSRTYFRPSTRTKGSSSIVEAVAAVEVVLILCSAMVRDGVKLRRTKALEAMLNSSEEVSDIVTKRTIFTWLQERPSVG
jgi:hypothetical protein